MSILREQRQEEAAIAWEQSNRKQIVNACPRFGKTRVALNVLNNNTQYKKVLLLYSRIEIKGGWKYVIDSTPNVEWHYSTFKSVHKIVDNKYDLVIWDEPQEASINQLISIGRLTKRIHTLGLTGTLTIKTKADIYTNTLVDTCYEYTIAEGVREGILADYEIYVHTTPLKGGEKGMFRRLSNIKNKLKNQRKQTRWIELKLINILQNSSSKQEKTIELLNNSNNERVLVFCGVTKIADSLGIPTYHSKSSEKETLEQFCNGTIEKLATINMLQTGITIMPINKSIANYISGNPESSAQKLARMIGYEYNNPSKKAELHIVCSDTDFEKHRIKTALQFFENSKIKWI